MIQGFIVQEVGRLPKRGKTTPRVERAVQLYQSLMRNEGDILVTKALINLELSLMEPAEQAAYYKANQDG